MNTSFFTANKLLREGRFDDAIAMYELLKNKIHTSGELINSIKYNIEYAKKIKKKHSVIYENYFQIKRSMNLKNECLQSRFIIKNPHSIFNEIESYLINPPKNCVDLFRLAFLYCILVGSGEKKIDSFENFVTNKFNLDFFDVDWITAPRLAFLASYPKRINALKTAVAASRSIFDVTFVSLNDFQEIPSDIVNSGVCVKIQKENLADNGKFYNWFPEGIRNAYVFTIDDDIEYPEDYSLTLSLAARRYHNKCVVGLHGVILKQEISSYYKSRFAYNFKSQLLLDLPVDILGTGTICYWSNLLKLNQENFSTMRMVDLWFALVCHKQGVPLICLSRESNYLKEHEDHKEEIQKTSIYTQDSNSDNFIGFNLLALALLINDFKKNNQIYLNDYLRNILDSKNNALIESLNQATTRYIFSGHHLDEDVILKAVKIADLSNLEYIKALIVYVLQRCKKSIEVQEFNPALWASLLILQEKNSDLIKLSVIESFVNCCEIKLAFVADRSDVLSYLNGEKLNATFVVFLIIFCHQRNLFSEDELVALVKNHASVLDYIVISSVILRFNLGLTKTFMLKLNNGLKLDEDLFKSILGHPYFSFKYCKGSEGCFEENLHLKKFWDGIFSGAQIDRMKIAFGFDLDSSSLGEDTREEFSFKKLFDTRNARFLDLTCAKKIRFFDDNSYSLVLKDSIENLRFYKNKSHLGGHICLKSIAVCFTSKNPRIDLLESALLSIVNQTDFDIDIYFVDDGSLNSSNIINAISEIKNYCSARSEVINFYYYKNKNSIGTYSSRNKFLKFMNLFQESCKYDYISFHDDDDVSLPGRLKYQIDLMESSQAMCCRARNARIIDGSGVVGYENDGEMFGVAPITSIYNPRVFKDLGYFDSVISRGDTEFLSRISSCYGENALIVGDAVVMLCNQKLTSLSWSVKLKNSKLIQKYRKNYRAFHSENQGSPSRLFIDAAPIPRKFSVPVGLLSLSAIDFAEGEKVNFDPIV